MSEVIVGVDGSPGSHLAVDLATDLAAALDAPLRIVHAYVPWSAQYPFNLSGADAGTQQLEGTQHAVGEGVLHDAARRARERGGIEPATELVAADPAEALIERSGEARLLVIGSRGFGSIKGLLLGSVSQRCVQLARCPVTVVPQG